MSLVIEAWFDGAFLWDEGHAAYGAIVRKGEAIIFQESKYMGANKNWSPNCSEYAATIAILKFLISIDTNPDRAIFATVYGDSRMVVEQMNGRWKSKDGAYLNFYREALLLKKQLPCVNFKWIPRAKNEEADSLSKLPLKPYYRFKETESDFLDRQFEHAISKED